VPKEIIYDRYTKFTSNFLKGSFKGFGTNINFSTTYHPKSIGKIERVNQIIQDMLRMYEMD
jgi:transposase InsO family protein